MVRSGIINHRRATRQRHLSGVSDGTDDNIASAYFAAQYGGSVEVGSWGLERQSQPSVWKCTWL